MFNKKGVSPLITTLLIIGFVVTITAVVVIWGTSFTQKMQETTEKTAQRQIICSTDVMLDIKNVEISGDKIKLLIENSGNINISKFNIRVYGSSGIDSVETTSGLKAYGIQLFEVQFDPTKTGTVNEVEAFPSLIYEEENIICSNTYDKESIEQTQIAYSDKIFYVKDDSLNNVASFDNDGNIVLKGTCSISTCDDISSALFVVKDSNNNAVSYINVDGSLCLETGDCSDQSASCAAPDNSFVIRNSNNEDVAYISSTGDLCLKGSLIENGAP